MDTVFFNLICRKLKSSKIPVKGKQHLVFHSQTSMKKTFWNQSFSDDLSHCVVQEHLKDDIWKTLMRCDESAEGGQDHARYCILGLEEWVKEPFILAYRFYCQAVAIGQCKRSNLFASWTKTLISSFITEIAAYLANFYWSWLCEQFF